MFSAHQHNTKLQEIEKSWGKSIKDCLLCKSAMLTLPSIIVYTWFTNTNKDIYLERSRLSAYHFSNEAFQVIDTHVNHSSMWLQL
jgi:hypothetical protein